MRARICSAISCDVFARVVCLRLRRVAKLSTYSISPVPHALATHYFLRLTRARGRRFLRGCKILLNDFWYFSSLKSTIREKFLYDTSLLEFFSRANIVRPYHAKSKSPQQPKEKIKTPYAFSFAYTGAKEKAIKKKTPSGDFALCGARQGLLALDPAAF